MFKKILPAIFILLSFSSFPQSRKIDLQVLLNGRDNANKLQTQVIATTGLIDAALNSVNSLNSLIKKENYRTKIGSFNNPASSDMGFNLELEIQTAIKPLLDKSQHVNTNKFSSIVSSLLTIPSKNTVTGTLFGTSTILSSLVGIVSNLAVSEKKITKEDLDSFMFAITKYFVQYEKLDHSNQLFTQNINKFSVRLQELQFDIKEYTLDFVVLLNKGINRQELRSKSVETVLLKYLNKETIDSVFNKNAALRNEIKYPSDGIKTAKEIVYNIQKMFAGYQEIYTGNYNEIKNILLQSKELGKNINSRQIDTSIKELEQLFNESKDADIVDLRLNTLADRLNLLVNTEQIK